MVRLNWTLQAAEDLENIAEYIAKDSVKYASLQVKRITERTLILKIYPEAGRIVPELMQSNIKELISGNYRIIYKIINKNRIDILTIFHTSRLLNNELLK
ncbi:MAG: type II toxin-antitoxin system RelE/ParE family toxin [Bacteroidales bacterium]